MANIIYWDLLSTGLVNTETVICPWKVYFAEFHGYLIILQNLLQDLQSHMYTEICCEVQTSFLTTVKCVSLIPRH